MEQELTKAKEELMETVNAVDNDKRFYESQLKTLGDTLKTLAEREAELAQVITVLSIVINHPIMATKVYFK